MLLGLYLTLCYCHNRSSIYRLFIEDKLVLLAALFTKLRFRTK
jgi:hypothetical protein